MLKWLLNILKRKLSSPFKKIKKGFISNPFKKINFNPIKKLVRKLTKDFTKRKFTETTTINKDIKKTGGTIYDNIVWDLPTSNLNNWKRKKLIAEISVKSRVVEQILNIADYATSDSAAHIHIPQRVIEINRNKDTLNAMTNKELENVKNMIDKELQELGLDTSKNLEDMDKDDIFQKGLDKAYSEHMSEWQVKFLETGSDGKTGEELSDERKQEIWADIENDYTFDRFVESKGFSVGIDN